jgi:hypothetical protein
MIYRLAERICLDKTHFCSIVVVSYGAVTQRYEPMQCYVAQHSAARSHHPFIQGSDSMQLFKAGLRGGPARQLPAALRR